MKLCIKTYIIRRTYTSVILEINSEEEYNIIISESDNDDKVITLKSIKLIIKAVFLLKSESLQKSREETLKQIQKYSVLL